MKRLLTTAMVLVMLVTMFCASPAVTAAGTPAMDVKIVYSTSANDTISANFKDVNDAMWVVWSVKDADGNYVFVQEKRGNKAEEEGFSFEVALAEKSNFVATTNYVAEAKIAYAGGSVRTLTKEIEYKDITAVQDIINGMLADPQVYSVTVGTDELMIPRPAYYKEAEDEAIIAYLRTTYDGVASIEPDDFVNKIESAMLFAALNSNSAATISTVIENYYDEIGLVINTTEKLWYDASATKLDVVTRLAAFEYASVPDFTNQFKTIAFLDRLAFEPLSNVMNFLDEYNNRYVNYGTETTLDIVNNTTSITNLDFSASTGYDASTMTDANKERAAEFIAGNYNTLDELESKFAELLTKLADPDDPDFVVPAPPVYNPPVVSGPMGGFGGSTGGSSSIISVGTSTPSVDPEEEKPEEEKPEEEKPEEFVNPFKDIEGVDWAKEAILALAKEGVINGVSEEEYQPNANVTREQFVKIIVNTFGLEGSDKAAAFEDVDQDAWYASYINTAVELGIINGVSEDSFGVGKNISRQDMTLIMYRVAKYVGIDLTADSDKSFDDADEIADYAEEAVTALYRAGIVNGIGEGVFGGSQTATRAQAAKLCYDLREVK